MLVIGVLKFGKQPSSSPPRIGFVKHYQVYITIIMSLIKGGDWDNDNNVIFNVHLSYSFYTNLRNI